MEADRAVAGPAEQPQRRGALTSLSCLGAGRFREGVRALSNARRGCPARQGQLARPRGGTGRWDKLADGHVVRESADRPAAPSLARPALLQRSPCGRSTLRPVRFPVHEPLIRLACAHADVGAGGAGGGQGYTCAPLYALALPADDHLSWEVSLIPKTGSVRDAFHASDLEEADRKLQLRGYLSMASAMGRDWELLTAERGESRRGTPVFRNPEEAL